MKTWNVSGSDDACGSICEDELTSDWSAGFIWTRGVYVQRLLRKSNCVWIMGRLDCRGTFYVNKRSSGSSAPLWAITISYYRDYYRYKPSSARWKHEPLVFGDLGASIDTRRICDKLNIKSHLFSGYVWRERRERLLSSKKKPTMRVGKLLYYKYSPNKWTQMTLLEP